MATRKITEIKDNATGDINQMRDNDIINNVPSTTSSDAAITTSVPLVAEDGSIVKIKRDSFVEAIASVFAANNQTNFSKLFGVNGTTPMGIEPSALASVLGVTYQRVMKSETYTYTLSLGGESSVEIMFFINTSGPKCCTYRFYFRDYGDSSYEHFGNNTGASVSVNALGDGVFTFSVSGYSMLYVKKLTGYYSLV